MAPRSSKGPPTHLNTYPFPLPPSLTLSRWKKASSTTDMLSIEPLASASAVTSLAAVSRLRCSCSLVLTRFTTCHDTTHAEPRPQDPQQRIYPPPTCCGVSTSHSPSDAMITNSHPSPMLSQVTSGVAITTFCACRLFASIPAHASCSAHMHACVKPHTHQHYHAHTHLRACAGSFLLPLAASSVWTQVTWCAEHGTHVRMHTSVHHHTHRHTHSTHPPRGPCARRRQTSETRPAPR
jgi:hypothetical protein